MPNGVRQSLANLLRGRGLLGPGVRAIRHSLHAGDRSADFPSLDALVSQGLLPVYERMQDGRRLGHDNALLSFVAEPGGYARLVGFRRVFARRKGLVPGDIVYDYEAAPLLHSFISRARCPVFYDTVDLEGLGDLFGSLVVRWPAPLVRNVIQLDEPGLAVRAGPKPRPDLPVQRTGEEHGTPNQECAGLDRLAGPFKRGEPP